MSATHPQCLLPKRVYLCTMQVPASDIAALRQTHTLIDVRTPAEYAKGHIPGALNLPLFSNAERARVGTVYKREGHESAVSLGLKIVGPRLHTYTEHAKELAGNRPLLLYCWRGGMRSGSLAWLLKTAGFSVKVITGGYKSFRTEATDAIATRGVLKVIGGSTGSMKTDILHALQAAGEHTIDLEQLAHHKGSAFGKTDDIRQPTTEHFLNLLWDGWCAIPPNSPVWIEDESRTIGSVWLPEALYRRMRSAPVFIPEKPAEERAAYLAEVYGDQAVERLEAGFRKIGDRLGGQHVKAALEALHSGQLAEAALIALRYYDKAYAFGMDKRAHAQIVRFDASRLKPDEIARLLIHPNPKNHGTH